MDEESLEDLGERVALGDPDAARVLHDRINPWVAKQAWSFVKQYTHSAEHDDLMQVAWIAILLCLPKYDRTRPLLPFLKVITARAMLAQCKGEVDWHNNNTSIEILDVDAPYDHDFDSLAEHPSEDVLSRVSDPIGRIVLREMHGLKDGRDKALKTVAAKLGMPMADIEERYHIALVEVESYLLGSW